MNSLKKFFHIFRSPALALVVRWGKCVRGRMLLISLLGIAGTLCSLALTLITRSLIDGAVASRSDALWHFGLLLVVFLLVERGMRVLTSLLRTDTSARLQKKLQRQMMDGILTRMYPGLKKYHSGDLVNRVFSDVSVVKNGILSMIPNLCSLLVSFTGAVIILASMDWRLVIALLLGSMVGAVIMLLFRNPMKKRHKSMQESESRLHSSVQETLENLRLIKASLSEEKILQRVHGDQQELEQKQRKQGFFSVAMNQGLGLMFDISWLACMLWGCASIFRGEMTYGSLAAIIQLIGRIQGPIASAADIAAQAYSVIASAERIQEVLTLPSEETDTVIEDFETIRLQDVTFSYEDGMEDVLRQVNCDIHKGDFVALTGISGGGKTSLFQLLLGIYTPVSGSVVFEDHGEKYEASRGTRSLFAYVPQGNSLISGTLRENLTLFCDNASEAQIREAARVACIDQLVDEIGLEAVLGERGVGLSEGQAQRVAVARALLSGAPILLLDEATSALDEETEAQLLKNISAMQGKTCLIVTHRKAALEICTRRLHMVDGHLKAEEM